jgi:2-polyprenyl-3-methyl-5-hydroxy-6-metoxy-1,4-benzoquinol methylase
MIDNCCRSSLCIAAERQFSQKRAKEDLQQYRADGPGATTRLLLAGLATVAGSQKVLLDIGSGVGAVVFELLKQGMTRAVGVDLSAAYVAAASDEVTRIGRSDSARFVHGDFLDVASEISPADVVTLDRVICCYPAYERLLDEALRHTKHYLALSYPRSIWYVRLVVRLENIGRWMSRNPFRTFVHPATGMENRIRREGFELLSRSCTWTWCADVYERS